MRRTELKIQARTTQCKYRRSLLSDSEFRALSRVFTTDSLEIVSLCPSEPLISPLSQEDDCQAQKALPNSYQLSENQSGVISPPSTAGLYSYNNLVVSRTMPTPGLAVTPQAMQFKTAGQASAEQ